MDTDAVDVNKAVRVGKTMLALGRLAFSRGSWFDLAGFTQSDPVLYVLSAKVIGLVN